MTQATSEQASPAPPARENVPVTFLATAAATGKRRNDVTVHMTRPWALREWVFASDEPPAHGGDETAPQPLAIFAAALTSCFMTQVRTFARAASVPVESLDVRGRFEWVMEKGTKPTAPYRARPGSFHLDVDLQSSASLEDKQTLVATAAKGCFIEAVLSVPVEHRLRHGDDWVACPLS